LRRSSVGSPDRYPSSLKTTGMPIPPDRAECLPTSRSASRSAVTPARRTRARPGALTATASTTTARSRPRRRAATTRTAGTVRAARGARGSTTAARRHGRPGRTALAASHELCGRPFPHAAGEEARRASRGL
jgi:hypothetical protein